ncbi:hypothetical protein Q8F85_27765, partial [Klebsiella pneumoniae]|nr:hypothetical protein [Klebsiella pneumoniae]
IGMVFQNFNLFPHMTALENVMLAPRRVLKKSQAECRELAQRVLEQAPPQAVWLGWSLGGLVASQVAIMRPERVQALV